MTDAASWPRRLAKSGYLAALNAVERRRPFWSVERVRDRQRRRLRAIEEDVGIPVFGTFQAIEALKIGDVRFVDAIARTAGGKVRAIVAHHEAVGTAVTGEGATDGG